MSDKRVKLLIIDDEPAVRRFLSYGLEPHGYEIAEAETAHQGIEKAVSFKPDLVILDLGLPDMNGIEVLQKLRAWSKVPVVVLTVHDSEADKVALLEAGADDYLTKPFSMAELVARLRVARRHAQASAESSPVFKSDRLEIDMNSKAVRLDGNSIRLTSTEYEILRLLAVAHGRVVTTQNLINEVWAGQGGERVHYLRVYMGHLRKKLELDPSNPTLILTEPGVGYRLHL